MVSCATFQITIVEDKPMATVVGLFDNSDQAQRAVEQLRANGVSPNDIGVAMRQGDAATTTTTTETDVTRDAGSGIVTGAVGGGVLGGLAGLLVGIGAIAIPGLGALVVAGPVATTLIGAGVGAAAGGLVGALMDAGVPEEEARVYETGVRQGGVLVTARVAAGMEQLALDVMNSNGARDIRNDPNLTNANVTNTTYNETAVHNRGHEVAGEATGGVAGAATGAAIGSVAGPVGTVAGGVIGATAGGAAGKGVADAADEDRAENATYQPEADTTYRTDTTDM
jgi:hypothetical protein